MNSQPDQDPGTALFRRLFVFEMALNLLGDPLQGFELIEKVRSVTSKYGFNCAFKFQPRIHETHLFPDGIPGKTYVPDSERDAESLLTLKSAASRYGFFTAFTAYDEDSLDWAVKNDFDIISVASCSFTDWPLLEKIVRTPLPVMAFTADVTLDEIDRVHLFFKNRDKILCIMHCIENGSFCSESLNLGQIDVLKHRFPAATIGISVNEAPDNQDVIKIAIAKGANVFERSIIKKSNNSCQPDYLSTFDTIDKWLSSARDTFKMCQIQCHDRCYSHGPDHGTKKFRRGAFARRDLFIGSILDYDNTYCAFPCAENQLSANEMSRKIVFSIVENVSANQPIARSNVTAKHVGLDIAARMPPLFEESDITIGGISCYSISNRSENANKLIIYAHGGGYVSGSSHESRNSAVNLAWYSSCDVLSVDYRLATEHPFPAALEDVLTVYGHLLSEGRSSSDIGLYGESAGGGIILALIMMLMDNAKDLPAAVVCSSPWADLTNTGGSHSDDMNSMDITLKTKELHKNAKMYAGDQSLLNPYISPAHGDFSGFPPMLIYAGTREILQDDARLVAGKARDAGGEVTLRIIESMPHVFTTMTGVFAEADKAMEEIGRFFMRHLSISTGE